MKKIIFISGFFALMLGINFLLKATNYVVSGAGSSEVNGTYVEDGTANGKPMYTYDTYVLAYNGTYWVIGDEFIWEVFAYYFSWDAGETPPSTGWDLDMDGTPPVPSVEIEGRSLSYSSNTFFEKQCDDGSIETIVTITHNEYGGDFFTGSNGDDFVTAGKTTVTNLPAGLDALITRTSASTLTLKLIGNASSHANANDISNLTVEFTNSAFDDGSASEVSNYLKSNIAVDFMQVHTVCASGCDYSTITLALVNASVENYDVLELSAESYTESLSVGKAITIRGKGAANTIIQAHADYNSATNRVITAFPAAAYIKLYDLTIKNGKINGTSQFGGGINSSTNLYIYNCIIKDNILSYTGDVNLWGGGIFSDAYEKILYIENSLIYNNKTISDGFHYGGGMAVNNTSTFTIKNSTISGNTITKGGGEALWMSSPVVNSSVINCTISENTYTGASGSVTYMDQGTCTYKNTIIYGNTASSFMTGINSPTINAYNSIMTSLASINGVNSNNSTSDPLLGSLADNGGPTQTYAIGESSPAINGGTTGLDIPDLDQRRYTKNSTRDIGAYEYEGTAPNVWDGSSGTDWNTAANWSKGTVPANTDNVIIDCLDNQPVIDEDPATPAECNALTINGLASLTINAAKALTISGGLTNNGLLTLKSDATGTGTIIDNGTISGTGAYRAECYITGEGGGIPDGRFWYVGSPVSSSYSNVFSASGVNKLWYWTETTNSYTELTSNTSSLNVLTGYAARIGANSTLTFTGGTLNTGNISNTNLTRTGVVNEKRGYHLIGNPYPSFLDWESATKTNLLATMWYRTDNLSSVMVYDTYNATSHIGTNNNQSGAVTKYLPPMQAFWVRVDADGNTGQIALTNVMRSHQDGNLMKSDETQNDLIRLQVSNGANTDETVLYFNTDADNGYDDYDSPKMFVNNKAVPELYTVAGNETLVINGMHDVESNLVIPVGFKTDSACEYSITATEITGLESVPVILEDILLNEYQNLKTKPEYTFASEIANNITRFKLHFAEITGINNNSAKENIFAYSENKQLTLILNNVNGQSIITVYDVLGNKLFNKITTEKENIFPILTSGIYFVKTRTAKGIYVDKVFVK